MSMRLHALLVCSAVMGATGQAVRADDAPGPAWLRAPYTQGPVAGTVAREESGVWWGMDGTLPLGLRMSDLRAPFERAPILGLRLSVAGDNKTDVHDLRYTALLDRRGPRAGEWLGLSVGSGDGGARLHLGLGLWRSFKPIQVEAGMGTSTTPTKLQEADHWGYYRYFRDTLSWIDTTTYSAVSHMVLNTTAHSAVRWQVGRLEVSAIGGVVFRSIGTPVRWAQATVNVQAAPGILLMAAFGQRPTASMAFDPLAGPRTMLGVRLTPWATREGAVAHAAGPHLRVWSSKPVREGRTLVRVRSEDATRVELTGDFTDWAPIPLVDHGRGWWGAELSIAPGLHQVQVRMDGGAWQPPPGLPTTQGDFAGTAGVLVVD